MSGLKQKNKKLLQTVYNDFGNFTDLYQADFSRFCEELCFLESNLRDKKGKLLDIACGPGILSAALSSAGFEVTGADKYIFPEHQYNYFNIKDIESLKLLWNKYKIKVVGEDYLNLPKHFSSESFEVIVCDAFVEHLSISPRHLFNIAHGLLKKDGNFLLTTPNVVSALKRFRFLAGKSCLWDIKEFWRADLFLGHHREYTIEELKFMCAEAGFEVVDIKTKNVFPLGDFRKNGLKNFVGRLFSRLISYVLPNSGEMIYLLARKK